MKLEQQIPCPNCSTLIPFDTGQLLMGVNFECPNCHSTIGLATESETIVEEALKKLDDIKKQGNNNG